jgi:hypothetical protein
MHACIHIYIQTYKHTNIHTDKYITNLLHILYKQKHTNTDMPVWEELAACSLHGAPGPFSADAALQA